MKTTQTHPRSPIGGDRYIFDFHYCTSKKNYAQVDSDQDAWYFGTWANPLDLRVVTYAEGDVTVKECESEEEFVEEMERISQWNKDHGFTFSIDPLGNEAVEDAFKKMGLIQEED